MKRRDFFSTGKVFGIIGAVAVGLWVWSLVPTAAAGVPGKTGEEVAMKLPKPRLEGTVSVERAISERRTVRSFRTDNLSLEDLSQLLWAAQGITGERGFRAAPSAGALYPMDVYAVIGKNSVTGVDAGVYRYLPGDHALSRTAAGDERHALARASLGQMWMAGAPLNFVITAEYARVSGKYGERGVRYAMIEAGHVGTNIFLQAGAMGLGAGIVGAFRDREVTEVINSPGAHEPLLIMPVGWER